MAAAAAHRDVVVLIQRINPPSPSCRPVPAAAAHRDVVVLIQRINPPSPSCRPVPYPGCPPPLFNAFQEPTPCVFRSTLSLLPPRSVSRVPPASLQCLSGADAVRLSLQSPLLPQNHSPSLPVPSD
ncbi:hypothetical protein QE152_g1401 [Popillia japonica]|uniref:Uncharacterized protein n=1 Tax=Popillia japonica TaxID=7064 RepID=A0AAW1N344_POPJA